MKKETFKSYEDLPLMLSVPEMAAALGISRAGLMNWPGLRLSRIEDRNPHCDTQGQTSGMGRQTDRKDMI